MKIRTPSGSPTASLAASVLATLVVLSAAPAFGADKSLGRGVVQTTFAGLNPALRLESKDAAPKAVLVPGFGGRVLSYGLRNENILWNDPASASGAESGHVPGGFQTVFGPEVAMLPLQPALANGAYEFNVRKGSLVSLRSEDEKSVGGSIEKEVMFDPATGELGFLFRMKNTRDRDAALSFWHRIACQPGGYVLVPVNKKSRFPAGWSVRRDVGGKVTWDGAAPEASGVRVVDGVLVAKTGSGSGRVGADSDAQWMAYALGRTLFILHFPYYSSAVYSEGGNSVTFAWDERMTELQPMGPEARIRSRKSAELPMKWALMELPSEVTTPEQARALAALIPVSPFL
jgi:hypothetical protein